MKLYIKPGACSMAAHIALIEAGTDFALDLTDTSAGTTQSGKDFRTISPNGYVPALDIGAGEVITENPAVLQYIADQAPDTALAPANGSLDRIRLQELLNFLSSELHKAFGPFFSGEELTDAARAKAEAGIRSRAAHVERLLTDGRDHLTGEAFTIADAYAFVILNWTNFIGVSLEDFPLTQSFMGRVRTRPAAQQAMRSEGLIPKENAA